MTGVIETEIFKKDSSTRVRGDRYHFDIPIYGGDLGNEEEEEGQETKKLMHFFRENGIAEVQGEEK